MESPSLSESDQEVDINVITYADVVKKGKDVSQYQVQNEDVALEIAIKQSMAKVCNLFAINSYKIPNLCVCRKLKKTQSKTFYTF